MTFNPKFLFYASILLIFAILAGFTHFQKVESEKIQEELMKEKLKVLELEKNKITEIKVNVTIIPTPYTIHTYMPVKFDNRMNLGEWYNWKANNASGYKQLNVSATFYGYREFDSFKYYDYNWGRVFTAHAPQNTTYFFALFHIEMDDSITGKDVRMYLPQQNNFMFQLGDEMYKPVIFDYEHNQIQQLEETWDYYHVDSVIPYAYEYGKEKDNVTNVNKPSMQNKYWLYGGKSNSEDGYIIFNIPKGYNKRLVYLNADFWSFGNAAWRIYNG